MRTYFGMSNCLFWHIVFRTGRHGATLPAGAFAGAAEASGAELRVLAFHWDISQGEAKTKNHCASNQSINQWNIFPHAEVDMVVAHLLHKVRVSEEGLTIRRVDDSKEKSMRFRQNLTKQANAEKHCFPPYSKRVQWCTLMINDVEWD